MKQWTGSKLEKECIKAVYCHPTYLIYMQSTLCRMLGWMKHKLESRFPEETSITFRYAEDTTLMAEREEEVLSLLMKVKQQSAKAGLKLNIQKMKIMASDPITPWQIHGDKIETLTEFIFLGFNIIADSDCSHEIENHLLLGRKSTDITLLTDVHIVEAVFFPAIMYRCKNGTIKKAECEGIDAFKLWC